MRQALKDTILPKGGGRGGKAPIFVRKDEAVSYCVYAMQRRKDLYGEDANDFRPDRWDPDVADGPDLTHINWGYLPFNGGPRICLGRMCSLCTMYK
jgi:cytochrome P450